MFYLAFYLGDEKREDASYLHFQWIKTISLNIYHIALFYNSQKSHTQKKKRQEKKRKYLKTYSPKFCEREDTTISLAQKSCFSLYKGHAT